MRIRTRQDTILLTSSLLLGLSSAQAVEYPGLVDPAPEVPGGIQQYDSPINPVNPFGIDCVGPNCGPTVFGFTEPPGCFFIPGAGTPINLPPGAGDLQTGLFDGLKPIFGDDIRPGMSGFYDILVMLANDAPPLPNFDADRSSQSSVDFDLIKGTMSSGASGGIDIPVDSGYSWTATYELSANVDYYTTSIGDLRFGSVPSASALAYPGISSLSFDPCRFPQVPTDPSFVRTGRHGGNSWGESVDDQWAVKRVGFDDAPDSAWNLAGEADNEVVVAIVDSGLDWHHPDINWSSLWQNEGEIPDNGIDDDRNGYVDDIIGWDFVAQRNRPWDYDGHGTMVAGIIAAAHNESAIAGVNPNAKLMVLRALGNFGTTRASLLAEAIVYAADNGADIINLSVGGTLTNPMEAAALKYASDKGVLIVVAAGNEGVDLDDYGPGGSEYALTVGATYFDDRTAAFSNLGAQVDLTAPGVDVLSLRARSTDVNYRPTQNAEYESGTNLVGNDLDMVFASGTSFSAPIVAGTASLMLQKDPTLTADQLRERLLMTAEDVDDPGVDRYSGYGMLDARAALSVDAAFSIDVEIGEIQFIENESGGELHILGTADADQFKRAWLQIGAGETPARWIYAGQKRKLPIRDGVLARIPLDQLSDGDVWQVVVHVEHRNGVVRSGRRSIRLN